MSERNIELVQGKTGIEMPLESGNWILLKEEGYSPVEMLVGAIGACGVYVYQSILTKSKIPYRFGKSSVAYKRDESRKSSPLQAVKIEFEITVPTEFQARAERALKLIHGNCPVMQSIDPNIVVTEQVHFN